MFVAAGLVTKPEAPACSIQILPVIEARDED
jgi:hypothetical protein